jgi:hypothetical protein
MREFRNPSVDQLTRRFLDRSEIAAREMRRGSAPSIRNSFTLSDR